VNDSSSTFGGGSCTTFGIFAIAARSRFAASTGSMPFAIFAVGSTRWVRTSMRRDSPVMTLMAHRPTIHSTIAAGTGWRSEARCNIRQLLIREKLFIPSGRLFGYIGPGKVTDS